MCNPSSRKPVDKYGRLDLAFTMLASKRWMPLVDQTEENWDTFTTSISKVLALLE